MQTWWFLSESWSSEEQEEVTDPWDIVQVAIIKDT